MNHFLHTPRALQRNWIIRSSGDVNQLAVEASALVPMSTSRCVDSVPHDNNATRTGHHHRLKKSRVLLLLLSIGLMVLGLGFIILLRLYFLHGGSRLWFSSLIQVAGFPVLLLPRMYLYLTASGDRRAPGQPVFALTGRASIALVVLGLVNGLDSYLYSWGSSKLPASTSTILFATQLAFTAVAAFLLVRQRFTPYRVNAVFLLVLSAIILGLQADHDRPAGITNGKYFLGFAMTLCAAALFGVFLPLVELVYGMIDRRSTYALYLEAQIVISAISAAFCLVGMAISGDFRAVPREAAAYGLGEHKYWLVVVFCAVLCQSLQIGNMGVIGCASSLMAGIVNTFLVPFGEVLAVILLDEKFTASKGISVVLAVSGFGSYLYGDWKREKKTATDSAAEAELGSGRQSGLTSSS